MRSIPPSASFRLFDQSVLQRIYPLDSFSWDKQIRFWRWDREQKTRIKNFHQQCGRLPSGPVADVGR
ncbi:MAG: hypothetical protein EZS28_041821, partial [Streblomastix strix]